RIALIVVFTGFDPAVERVVVARRILLRLGFGILRLLVVVLRRRLRLLGRVAMQGMHRRRLVFRLVVVILRWRWWRRGFVPGALHPRRRGRGGAVGFLGEIIFFG